MFFELANRHEGSDKDERYIHTLLFAANTPLSQQKTLCWVQLTNLIQNVDSIRVYIGAVQCVNLII